MDTAYDCLFGLLWVSNFVILMICCLTAATLLYANDVLMFVLIVVSQGIIWQWIKFKSITFNLINLSLKTHKYNDRLQEFYLDFKVTE